MISIMAWTKPKQCILPYEMAYPMNLVADREALQKAQGQPEYECFRRIVQAKGITD